MSQFDITLCGYCRYIATLVGNKGYSPRISLSLYSIWWPLLYVAEVMGNIVYIYLQYNFICNIFNCNSIMPYFLLNSMPFVSLGDHW